MSVPTEVPVDDEGEVAPEPASEDGRGGHLVAVVTGASRGIGRFVADALEDAGYAVERGSSAVAPVTDRAALTAWVDEIVERHGRIDVLVNNAGVIDTEVDLFASDPEQWWHTQEVNVLGAYLMTWLVAPHMLAAGGGRIVNLNSGAARRAGRRRERLQREQDRAGAGHRLDPPRGVGARHPGVRPDARCRAHRHDRGDGRARRPHRVDRPGRRSPTSCWPWCRASSTRGRGGSCAPASTRSPR